MEACYQGLPLLLGVVILFGIIIWDMDKQYDLSHMIHDDHTDIWKPMSVRDTYDWYSDADLCSLQQKSTMNLKKYRIRNCTNLRHLPSIVVSNKLICAVGMTLGRSCPAPLDGFYLYHLKDNELSNPLSLHLYHIIVKLVTHHIPIVFIGDSISKQNQENFLCEIMRKNIMGQFDIHGDLDLNMTFNISHLTIHWKRNVTHLDVYFVRMIQLRHHGMTRLRKLLHSVLSRHRKVMVIANIGGWYTSREKYRIDMEVFLRYLNEIGQTNLVFFRETSAQHWNFSSNGYFKEGSDRFMSSCVELEDASSDFDWKNRDVKNILLNDNLNNVHIIPFRDITAPLHNMHAAYDCSQFCYFPQLWEVVYKTIDLFAQNMSFIYQNTISTHSVENISSTTIENISSITISSPPSTKFGR